MGSDWGGWGERDRIVWFVVTLVVRAGGGREVGFAALCGKFVVTCVSVGET